jgi:antitoxin HicB
MRRLTTTKRKDYPVRIEFDDQDNFFTADFPDLPGCSASGDTVEEAYENALKTKEEWIRITVEQGFQIPDPTASSDFSGRILLRLPTSLHAAVAFKAQANASSLNQYLVHLLAGAVIGDTVEGHLEEIKNRIAGCEDRVHLLAHCVHHLSKSHGTWGSGNASITVQDTISQLPAGVLSVSTNQLQQGQCLLGGR